MIFHTMRLAFFILPVKSVSAHVAKEAFNLARIKNYEKEAHRRRWLTNNRYKNGGPTRALLHELQLLQYLVFCESTKYEQYHEGDRNEERIARIAAAINNPQYGLSRLLDALTDLQLCEEDLIIRYLKSTVQFSHQNSIDLITGIACMVCNLQPKDVSKIYSIFKAITPNYCSKRKHQLMQRLQRRFEKFIFLSQVAGKSKKSCFVGQEQLNSRRVGLVEKFFYLTTPWGTDCPKGGENSFSDRLNSWIHNIYLGLKRRYTTGLDKREIAQLHTLLCPDCFSQLMHEMIGQCPRERLTLPTFYLSANEDSNRMKKDSRELEQDEETARLIGMAADYLDRSADRRAKIDIKRVAVTCDDQKQPLTINGLENSYLDVAASDSAKFQTDENTQLIKVSSWDDEGELPIGLLLLDRNKIKDSLQHQLFGWKRYRIWLSEDKRLIFKIGLVKDANNGPVYLVKMFWQERAPDRSFEKLRVQRLSELIKQPLIGWSLLISMTLLFGLTIYLVTLFGRSPGGDQPAITTNASPTEYQTHGETATEPERGGKQSELGNKPTTPESISPAGIITLELGSGSSSQQADTEIRSFTIPANIETVRFRFDIAQTDIYQHYLISVRKDARDPLIVWRSQIEKADHRRQGRTTTFTTNIPARIFASEVYSLILIGTDQQGKQSTIELYPFKLVKL